MTTALTALATTHGVIDRVHYHTAVVGTAAQPAAAACLAALLEVMVGIAHYADGGTACQQDAAGFSRR